MKVVCQQQNRPPPLVICHDQMLTNQTFPIKSKLLVAHYFAGSKNPLVLRSLAHSTIFNMPKNRFGGNESNALPVSTASLFAKVYVLICWRKGRRIISDYYSYIRHLMCTQTHSNIQTINCCRLENRWLCVCVKTTTIKGLFYGHFIFTLAQIKTDATIVTDKHLINRIKSGGGHNWTHTLIQWN